MVKKKVLAKKDKVKLTQSQLQSQKQPQKQLQKQSQSVSVNVNLVKQKRRKIKQPTQKIPPQFQYNLPPYNPFNFLSNPTNYTPPPKKEYIAYPEPDIAGLAGVLSNVPQKLEIEGREPEKPIAIKSPVQTLEGSLPAKAGEELVLPDAPLVEEQPEDIVAEVNPLISPEEEATYKNLTAQYRSVELPPALAGLTAEEEAKTKIAGLGKLFRQKKSKQLQIEPLEPEEPPSPAVSEITLASTASPFPPPSPSYSALTATTLFPPEQFPIDIGFPPKPVNLPPLNLPPRPPLIGAEEILNPQSEFLFEEGQTGRSTIFSQPLRQTTLSEFGIGSAPSIAEQKELTAEKKESKKKGRPKGALNKPKVELGQPQFAQPVSEVFAEPVQTGGGLLGLPIAEQPNITFLGGTQKSFTPESAPPPPVSGGLERKRPGTALPPKEEEFLANTPFFLSTQRSQSTL